MLKIIAAIAMFLMLWLPLGAYGQGTTPPGWLALESTGTTHDSQAMITGIYSVVIDHRNPHLRPNPPYRSREDFAQGLVARYPAFAQTITAAQFFASLPNRDGKPGITLPGFPEAGIVPASASLAPTPALPVPLAVVSRPDLALLRRVTVLEKHEGLVPTNIFDDWTNHWTNHVRELKNSLEDQARRITSLTDQHDALAEESRTLRNGLNTQIAAAVVTATATASEEQNGRLTALEHALKKSNDKISALEKRLKEYDTLFENCWWWGSYIAGGLLVLLVAIAMWSFGRTSGARRRRRNNLGPGPIVAPPPLPDPVMPPASPVVPQRGASELAGGRGSFVPPAPPPPSPPTPSNGGLSASALSPGTNISLDETLVSQAALDALKEGDTMYLPVTHTVQGVVHVPELLVKPTKAGWEFGPVRNGGGPPHFDQCSNSAELISMVREAARNDKLRRRSTDAPK